MRVSKGLVGEFIMLPLPSFPLIHKPHIQPYSFFHFQYFMFMLKRKFTQTSLLHQAALLQHFSDLQHLYTAGKLYTTFAWQSSCTLHWHGRRALHNGYITFTQKISSIILLVCC